MPYTSDSHEFDQLTVQYPKAKKILAEGDSWFSYPRRFFVFGAASNVVDHLGKGSKYVIYSTASNGDAALSMLSGEQKHAMMKRIKASYQGLFGAEFILSEAEGRLRVTCFRNEYMMRRREI